MCCAQSKSTNQSLRLIESRYWFWSKSIFCSAESRVILLLWLQLFISHSLLLCAMIVYRLAEQPNCRASDTGFIRSSTVAHIFIRSICTKRYSTDDRKKWREMCGREDEEKKCGTSSISGSNNSTPATGRLNGEWKKATRGTSVSDGRKIQKRIEEKTVVLLEQQVKRDSFAPSLNTLW